MKIAITGANGFIGRRLSEKLIKDNKIIVSEFNRKKCSLLKINTLKNFVSKKDVIIHLAAKNMAKDTAKNHSEFFSINTIGTLNLLEAIRLYGKADTHFIFTSSIFTLSSDKNINHYASSKFLAEKIVKSYSKEYKIKSAVLRLSNVYGLQKDDKPKSVIPIFTDKIYNDQPITINKNGNQKRDFIFINDVIMAIMLTIKNQKEKFISVNICGGKNITILQLIKAIESIIKKKAIIHYNKTHKEIDYPNVNYSQAHKKISFKPKYDIKLGLKSIWEKYEKS